MSVEDSLFQSVSGVLHGQGMEHLTTSSSRHFSMSTKWQIKYHIVLYGYMLIHSLSILVIMDNICFLPTGKKRWKIGSVKRR